MEQLYIWSARRIQSVSLDFKRYLWDEINWTNRLIVIVGARGVGKTTLMLQYIRTNLSFNKEVLYVSADDLYFTRHTLVDFTQEFYVRGGKFLFIDEIHKYENWSREIKNIYDNFPQLKLVITGSSATEIVKGEGDLSRRALFYHMKGLSLREFVQFQYNIPFPVLHIRDIMSDYLTISYNIAQKIKPIKLFEEYIQAGYYPFFKEDSETYHKRIQQIVNTVLESDIPAVYNVDYHAVLNIKKLLGIITSLVPFKPNIQKLSLQIGLSRETFIKYLQYLEKADILSLLYSNTKGISLLNKPEKIYLHNTNLIYSLAENPVNIGNVRETFFMNQLMGKYELTYPDKGDFMVNNQYLFEIGGKEKSRAQIEGIPNSAIVSDNIEFGTPNKIPLWLFGFLY